MVLERMSWFRKSREWRMVHTVGQSGSYSLPGFFLLSTSDKYHSELLTAGPIAVRVLCVWRLFGLGKEEYQGQARREKANGVLSGENKHACEETGCPPGQGSPPRGGTAPAPHCGHQMAPSSRAGAGPGAAGRDGDGPAGGSPGAERSWWSRGGYSSLRKAWRNVVSTGQRAGIRQPAASTGSNSERRDSATFAASGDCRRWARSRGLQGAKYRLSPELKHSNAS